MFEIFLGVIFGMVLVIVEIQYRHVKKKLERLEGLWLHAVDLNSGEVVFNHSLKMLEELSRLEVPDLAYKGLVIRVYRQGKGA